MSNKPARLFVVSGPSGSGKSTLVRRSVPRTKVMVSVSATTRKAGDGETEGKDYYFISKEEFLRRVERGEFLEHAQVFDNYYGTPVGPVKELLRQGKTVVLEIDVQGAMQVFENFPSAEGILVLPPGTDELKRRLCDRGRDDADTIEKRLAKAEWEISQARACDNFKYTIVNKNLEESIEEMVRLLGS
jgi:guanylate kinase